MDFRNCQLCPRTCGAQRSNGAVGFCGVDEHVRREVTGIPPFDLIGV